ncbi:MAG: cell division protein FtsL [Pseudomonadota bacterium]|jgi:cell division protein FtsL
MIRLNIVLLLAVILSALYLVRTQYESRRVFVEMERAQNEAKKLASEKEKLEVEKRAQATSLRVEKIARDKLQMQTANAGITQYVTLKAGTATSTTGAAE